VFTGLVEEKGTLVARRSHVPSTMLQVRTKLAPLVLGESIAVDGVCLTVTRVLPDGFEADVSSETLARTTLGSLTVGGPVNLERSLTLSARLGGHLVSGHVDDVCTLTSRVPEGSALCLTFEFPPRLARFIAQKGSVAVNGVSLTVNVARGRTFDVTVIPHTAEVTSIASLAVGDAVNLEVDLLSRYVARLLEVGSQTAQPAAAPDDAATHDANHAAWMDRLKRNGML
jgi:riboflavin synthase